MFLSRNLKAIEHAAWSIESLNPNIADFCDIQNFDSPYEDILVQGTNFHVEA